MFFGESLPGEFHEKIKQDLEKVDLLIVMGSSLKVAPVANVMHRVRDNVPQVLINMESLKHMERFDVHLLGYSDTITRHLAKELGWDLGSGKSTIVPGKPSGGSNISVTGSVNPSGSPSIPVTGSVRPYGSPNIPVSGSVRPSGSPNIPVTGSVKPSGGLNISVTGSVNGSPKRESSTSSPTKPDMGFIIEPFQQGHLPWVWHFEGAIQNPKDNPTAFGPVLK